MNVNSNKLPSHGKKIVNGTNENKGRFMLELTKRMKSIEKKRKKISHYGNICSVFCNDEINRG